MFPSLGIRATATSGKTTARVERRRSVKNKTDKTPQESVPSQPCPAEKRLYDLEQNSVDPRKKESDRVPKRHLEEWISESKWK